MRMEKTVALFLVEYSIPINPTGALLSLQEKYKQKNREYIVIRNQCTSYRNKNSSCLHSSYFMSISKPLPTPVKFSIAILLRTGIISDFWIRRLCVYDSHFQNHLLSIIQTGLNDRQQRIRNQCTSCYHFQAGITICWFSHLTSGTLHLKIVVRNLCAEDIIKYILPIYVHCMFLCHKRLQVIMYIVASAVTLRLSTLGRIHLPLECKEVVYRVS